ncbi:serine dehydratase subunit alpha family protein [Oscillibacter valericigenes]|uniref:L-cysteine desulfidase family protein n=1 Tax=Oscillibacter valericigenes TaxID=351091 RepID=UPI001F42014B|nr:L-serine ammonia-lyase, iron-sulfur-dependent, subunit alpha [Oscillibacter valericigenes]MCF2665089.1 serine dehydratase subunit alpha family protein [Oscillibacter valericigenes]
MERTSHYEDYVKILEEELIPAMGCTEPIAIALAAAKAREALGTEPEQCRVEVSGNIIKNVKAVTVPNTGGLKGIEASAAAGMAAGRPELGLEVLSQVTPEEIEAMKALMERCAIRVVPALGDRVFFINVTVMAGEHTACCEIVDFHTNIVRIQRDTEVLFQAEASAGDGEEQTDRSVLSVEEIVAFADCLDTADVAELLDRQIAYNTAISEAGMKGGWGAEVGRTLRSLYGDDVAVRAKAAAAAGSDARMSGCELPVVIVSGSGNQGMTTSLPVIEYARDMGASHEELLRALTVANLVTIHQKTGIGRLSAFCGAVSAGCGAAAGIAYLKGGRYQIIAHTIANTLAICSGMICDGAKPSCAAKIAAAVDAGLMGYHMYVNGGHEFVGGEGIIKKGVENTIDNVGRLARLGMRGTDQEILDIMVGR